MINKAFWKNRHVLVTGHTGFKGAWLCLWLHAMGARVSGLALEPPTEPNLYELLGIKSIVENDFRCDIREINNVLEAFEFLQPEIVFHLAAQSLVRESYKSPVETYATNVMGTVNLLEAVRRTASVRAVVNVTTDKVYENQEADWGYRENEPLGGHDPYSSSKACSELVTASFRRSFFDQDGRGDGSVAIASARAGNVIGGGDWAEDRLLPDCFRALFGQQTIRLRNPDAIRPWQHVLEPLSGYLMLAQLLVEDGSNYSEGWNFGPAEEDVQTVGWVVEKLVRMWGSGGQIEFDTENHPHETNCLMLDYSKAKNRLNWVPTWNLETALLKVVEWTRAYRDGKQLQQVSLDQIEQFLTAGK